MATATVARPAQALRARRDPPRPTLPTKRASVMENGVEPARKKQKLTEPHVITSSHILKKFDGHPPSMIVHLHPTYFRFEGQEGSFPYDSAMRVFLVHLRREEIPHEMVEYLLQQENVKFYDGCLIVEVHNHRSANAKDKGRHDSASPDGDQVKYSMHNYNSYVTPSPFAPYPKKAKESDVPEKAEAAGVTEQGKKSADKDKTQDGPRITTMVMHPTPLSLHKETLILANTPASRMPAPQPATPLETNGRSAGADQKMCLEGQGFYEFQADLLVATEPPLILGPVSNPYEAQSVLDRLAHPLHNDPPPSPKTRKRTTAEMAADDAHAAESQRKMLIMDERNKPITAGTSDTAGNAQILTFSRFKTIQMVREKHEEAERQKKEEEAQAAAQRRQQEEAERAEAQRKQTAQENARKLMNQRQHLARQHQEQMRNQQLAQQQAMMQNHTHPQQNNMMMNQQQANFQHAASMAQASPIVRQQTPMMNSSPMLQQGGFPMTATSSQGVGSPQRPTSAAMPNPAMAMARQASQQQAGSRNATPQLPQGTPSMPGAMPHRQPSQTPRMQHGSPAPGTPSAVPNMPLQAPQQSNFTPEQFAMLQARHSQMQTQNAAMNAGSPVQPNPGQNGMTPEAIQNIRQNQAALQAQNMARLVQSGATPQQAQQMLQQRQHMMVAQQRQLQQQRLYQQQAQHNANANAGQVGTPQPGMQQTPQMGIAHPQQGVDVNQAQQMTPQQRQQQQHAQRMQMQQAQAQVQALLQQYGGWGNIPQQVVQSLPQPVQMLMRQTMQRQQAARAQAMAIRAQQAQNAGQAVAGTGGGDPEYMQTLRQHQAMLAAQQANQGGQGQMNGMNMTHNMNFNQQFGGNGAGGNGDLTQQFQAMQNALNRSNGGMAQ